MHVTGIVPVSLVSAVLRMSQNEGLSLAAYCVITWLILNEIDPMKQAPKCQTQIDFVVTILFLCLFVGLFFWISYKSCRIINCTA